MKRVISVLILMVMLYFIYQWGIVIFKTSHDVKYNVETKDNTFSIEEKYNKTKQYDKYLITINVNDYKFSYEVENEFNKMTKIVDSIKYVEEDGTMCIYPIYTKDKVKGQIECSKNKETYSYTASLLITSLAQTFSNTLTEEKYTSSAWDTSTKETNEGQLTLYQDNFINNNYITLWNYTGIRIISSKTSTSQKVLDSDIYNNIYGVIVGKYYVIPDFDVSYQYSRVNIINIEDNTSETFDLDDAVSSDSYVCGVVGNNIYIFDKDNLREIEINPVTRKYKVVGNVSLDGIYYNGTTWVDKNIYDFKTDKLLFTKDYSSIKEFANYDISQVLESITNYYLLLKDGTVLRFNKDNLDNKIVLFKESDISEIKLYNDGLYFIIKDTLYSYTEETGTDKLIKYTEFQYNNDNIFDVYNSKLGE